MIIQASFSDVFSIREWQKKKNINRKRLQSVDYHDYAGIVF